MSRTKWLALFCVLGLAPAIAIKVAGLPAVRVAAPAQDHAAREPAFTVNQAAKSDRLPLFTVPAPAALRVPDTEPMPAPTPPAAAGAAGKTADHPWRNANASIAPAAMPPRQPPHKEARPSAAKAPQTAKAEAWHCRQDAMGGLLRSLDLSPRCKS